MDMDGPFAMARQGYLKKTGWLQSYRLVMPVKPDGGPVPWFTYPAISFVQGRLKPEMAVFLFYDHSPWWAERVARVVTCQYGGGSGRWPNGLPANVQVVQVPLGGANPDAQTIAGYRGQFDIVVLDGGTKGFECAKNAARALKADGIIIWDNSEGEDCKSGFKFLAEEGFKQLDFEGLGPGIVHGYRTSVLYRAHNCFGI